MKLRTNPLTYACSVVLLTGCSGTIEADGTGALGRPSAPGTTIDPATGQPVAASTGTPAVDPVTGEPLVPAQPTASSTCTPGVPGTSQLPRLTRVQYDNTIRDLVGLDSEPSSMLAPDTPGSVDQRAWDGYQTAAAALAAEALVDANARARVITCTPDADGTACARQFIEQFGQRAFRRPLTAEEITTFEALYANRAALTETGSFDEAAQLILEAFLVSPSFLTRAEITETIAGNYIALSGYEVASRLSYMLWNSMPDDALFAAADAGSLSTAEGILAEANRMLADPKAREMVAEFHQHYAHMGVGTRWAEFQRDAALFPTFSEAMVPLMAQETERLFDYLVFDQGATFQDLLLTPTAFVNATLAPLYGLDKAQYGADLAPVNLDPAARPGIFTRAGFLASHSLFNRTSPILRGAFLQKHVLCTPIGAPPPDAEGTPLPTEGLTTNRERTDAQTAGAACAGCHHMLINPTGFALEGFDAIGGFQAMDNGAPIDTSATVIIGSQQVPVTGALDLMTAIANSPAAQSCYAQQWVQYAYQREANSYDACTVDMLTTKLTQGGYTVINLVVDLTQTESFRHRAMEVTQ